MQRLVSVMRRVVTSVLVIWLVSLAAPCAAQEHGGLDAPAAPAAPDAGDGRGSVFVPGGFLGLVTPVRDRIALNVYGFYYGEVAVPVAQLDVPVRMTKFLTITPSYLYYEVPPSGLAKASAYPARFADTFEENQFRIDGTLKFSDSCVRDLRPQHVCQKVSSNSTRRYEPLSQSNLRSRIPSRCKAASGNRS